MRDRQTALWPLFLVSATALAYEIALTRYFAVATWSEYGYWVISMVMAGFALSGVVLALFRDGFVRHAGWLMVMLPASLICAAAAGFHLTSTNPFNPLQLQNQATWLPQLANIAGYYASLLPFFFLAGLYIGLTFVLNPGRIGRVYGFDLTGAGVGAAAVLLLMFVLHPFDLVAALLLALVGAALLSPGPRRRTGIAASLAALLAAEGVLLLDGQAQYNDFKAIYAPIHTPDAKVLTEIRSPRGFYQLLDDFTERVDTDISNDAGMLGLRGPPQTYGLYRDGTRIAALPKPGPLDTGYAQASLDALPYWLLSKPNVLLAGASGGFRVAEALALGASSVTALEPEPVLGQALASGLGPSPALPPDPRVRLSSLSPIAAAPSGGYDLIDLSADFLDAAEANQIALTTEAIARYLRALNPGGLISIPVSIRDFPVYALRVMATSREALRLSGVEDGSAHVLVYRSAWNARVVISREPWTAARIAAARRFADDRSFDLSYYPGIDVRAARERLYNDLPAVSFEAGRVEAAGPDDAVADEAKAVLENRATESGHAFNLAPMTADRPFFYAVLKLGRLDTILRRLEVLPQTEIGALVNLAVLAQASLLALLVLCVPLFAPRVRGKSGLGLLRAALYFPALGLGFLFFEIFLIEKASFYLNDRANALSLVLAGMLIFSGIGSLTAERAAATPTRILAI
ncbi:MAG: hypothetical protein FWD12_07310, partial [Alphaproteobacteria bacterium]|nr:hypothetical protein [Alphaproteobacteria bacterium]